jgi:glycosyltransferase involved in cell wall biosynthesis/tetratricopeptide (TPR) repeat protein
MAGLISPRSRESIITRADRAVQSGQVELALRLYREALDRTPRNPAIWVQCGHLLKHLGDLQAAEAAYRRAISFAPEAADPYLHLGHTLKLQDRREEAEAAYLRAFVLDASSDAARELVALGWSEDQISRLSGGAPSPNRPAPILVNGQSKERVRAVRPWRRKASLITLADRARDTGNWDSAARLYCKALRRNPYNAPIWVQYGHALKEAGHLERAESAYWTSIAHDPAVPDSWVQLGHVLKIRRKGEEAGVAYLRAFALDPSLPHPVPELASLGWSAPKLHELRRLMRVPVEQPSEIAAGDDEPSVPDEHIAPASPSLSNILSMGLDEQKRILIELGYFHEEFYLTINADVAESNVDPFQHYVYTGCREGRNPSPWFDSQYYLHVNPDAPRDLCPLLHFAADGGTRSRRRCSPYLIDNFRLPFDIRKPIVPTKFPVSPFRLHSAAKLKLAVHIHCFYIDCLPAIIKRLKNISIDFWIFLSAPDREVREQAEEQISSSGLHIKLSTVVPNRGRDLAPMIINFAKNLQEYDLVLHLHTKKSAERDKVGNEWFSDILAKLLFNKSYVDRIFQAFVDDQKLGAVAPSPYWRIAPFMVWGRNKDLVLRLMQRFGCSPAGMGAHCVEFPAGSMFWFRPRALAPILDAGFQYEEFPDEPIPDDGTIAHAIERCLFAVPERMGFAYRLVEPLPYERCWPKEITPTVSIIIPMRNGLPWIDAAIQSVLAQDTANPSFELIIVDNNSSDGSGESVSAFARSFDNVVFLTENTPGAGAARNRGMAAARGDYITFLDADDVLATDALARMTDLMRFENDLDFVTSSLVVFDEEGYSSPMPFGGMDDPRRDYIVVERKHYEDSIPEFRCIFSDFGPCAKLYRSSFLRQHGICFPERQNFEDNVFTVRVNMHASRIGIIPQPTYFYRKYRFAKGATQSTSLEISDFVDQLTAVKAVIREWKLFDVNGDGFRLMLLRALAEKIGWEIERFGTTDRTIECLAVEPEIVEAVSKSGLGGECLPEYWQRILCLRKGGAGA